MREKQPVRRPIASQRDTTHQRRSEAALRESEQRFRVMADTVPVLIWVTDEKGRCSFLNKTWLDFTGRPFESQADAGWVESVHPGDIAGLLAAFDAAFDAAFEARESCRVPGGPRARRGWRRRQMDRDEHGHR